MSFLRKKLRLVRDSFQYVYIPDASQTGLDLNSDFTLECKFFTNQPSLPNNDLICKWRSTANQRAYNITVYGTGGTLKLEVNPTGAAVDTTIAQVSWVPTAGQTYYIAAVYDKAAGTAKLFVDGAQIGTTQTGLATSIFNSSEAVVLGSYDQANGGTQSECLDGAIWDVRIFADKRTDQEVADDEDRVFVGNEDNLVACWNLNGDLLDLTSNNNDLTAFGSPSFLPYIPPGETTRSWLIGDSKLAAYYRLESDGSDETSNNNDLTVTGSPTFGAGMFGNGVVIDSNTKHLDKTSGCAGLPTGVGDFSFGVSIKRTGTLPASVSGYMVIGVRTDGNNQSAISPGSSDNNVRLSMFSAGNGSYSTQVPLALNEWERLLFVRYDSGTKVKVYKNGKLIATDSITARNHGSAVGIRVGESYSTWNCVFDDAFILSRKMLDDEAIAWTTRKRIPVIS